MLIESRNTRDTLIEASISDALARVLGQVVAEKRREFENIIVTKELEYRASFAEMKANLLQLDRKFSARFSSEIDRIDCVLGGVRDGPRGERGEIGPQGSRGEKGDRGDQGERGESGPRGETGAEGPRGEKGDRGDGGERGDPGEAGLRGERGEKGEPGRDGMPGRDGLNGLQGERGEAGKNGRDGVDGKDGIGFDDLEFSYDGERRLEIKFVSGERTKIMNLHLPIPIYRGKWSERKYERGDEVTHGGNAYRALCDTESKPPGDDWCIATNRGRDGHDGKDGQTGPQGPEGRPGRDLTQIGPDGRKW